jgi:hypothetical protein
VHTISLNGQDFMHYHYYGREEGRSVSAQQQQRHKDVGQSGQSQCMHTDLNNWVRLSFTN